ncbi:tRNA-splicing endonuclease subunit SEN54 [Skeletonema marinoi]|uniref:tRNA-splicing endonuclease subunit SEN54 n=1 Tax=Skeletonema marinoi TaxID=267567 RepID=A0AAD9DDA9_9STRA|nr:tRNA-splicing endonuclease subunit SEN54 [Skeletonema marinoi]
MSGSSKGDETLPLGVYVPPPTTTADGSDGSPEKQQHDGYVRIPDAKGRNTCGFSRPIGTVMETITVASKKRSHSLISKDLECTKDHDITIDHDATAESETNTKSETMQQKRTITEERLHPEEALFLHMRGLLRIEYNHETMSTQDLFCSMLPECKISLPAYLAYAHLRAQGYILIRYSAERIKLLLARSLNAREKDSSNIAEGGERSNDNNEVSESTQNTDIDNSSSSNIAEGGENSNDNKLEVSESTKNADIHNSSNNSWRQAKQKLSDDVATASPPCVVLFDEWNSNCSHDLNTRLAYFAYNPNSNFRRSNPGLPDFGVAIMPFQSSGVSVPSFDTISALVALCENRRNDGGDETEDSITAASNEIPLRIATVADCGAVIVYGVTRGDVPVIDKKKNDK